MEFNQFILNLTTFVVVYICLTCHRFTCQTDCKSTFLATYSSRQRLTVILLKGRDTSNLPAHFICHSIKTVFCLQDRHAWQGADGRSREDHDAERGDVRHLHGHRYGHPLLRRTRNDHLHKTTAQLWDSSSEYSHSSLSAQCCHTLNRQSSFVNKSSHLSNGFQSGCYTVRSLVLFSVQAMFRVFFFFLAYPDQFQKEWTVKKGSKPHLEVV